MPLHDHITCSHAKCGQISACSYGHFSPVRHHFPHYSFILCARLNRGSSSGRARASAGMWAQHCRQGTSPMKPDLVGIRGELCLARSPNSRSCHVSRGVPLLSFTPIGCRSGASVGSHHWLLLHALLLHNVRQPAYMRSDNPRLSNKRGEEGCTVLLGWISLAPLIRGWEVFYH